MNVSPVLILGGQGYIGSALTAHLKAAGVPVQSIDLELGNTSRPVVAGNVGYQKLTPGELRDYGSIVHLAGHSSVAACEQAPAEAFINNVTGFVELVHKLVGQKLVFASTVSVYVNTHGQLARESDPLPEPISYYDFHKQTMERYARLAYSNSYALRFGTVCGPAPAVRTELLLNSLVRAALQAGYVEVANGDAHRPLLGITDLCESVKAVVTGIIPPGCYNLASVNVRIGEVANYVANRFGVPCREVERQNRYDIKVDTQKFREASGMKFRDDLASLVNELQTSYDFKHSTAVRSE